MNLGGSASQHLVDVTLVGNVEDDLVLRGGEHPVERHGQLDDAEIRTQVAAGAGKGINERLADFLSESGQILIAEFLNVTGGMDGGKQRAEGGRLRKGGCHLRRRRRDLPEGGSRDLRANPAGPPVQFRFGCAA